ncbi:hypothetical protein DFH09DRAFT_1080149 [Mycena vulgaris]|nr:hypothetical protein DFH09DRAFT_1080149 [Mycena vulgaris]
MKEGGQALCKEYPRMGEEKSRVKPDRVTVSAEWGYKSDRVTAWVERLEPRVFCIQITNTSRLPVKEFFWDPIHNVICAFHPPQARNAPMRGKVGRCSTCVRRKCGDDNTIQQAAREGLGSIQTEGGRRDRGLQPQMRDELRWEVSHVKARGSLIRAQLVLPRAPDMIMP